jgi:hypothetical protein
MPQLSWRTISAPLIWLETSLFGGVRRQFNLPHGKRSAA